MQKIVVGILILLVLGTSTGVVAKFSKGKEKIIIDEGGMTAQTAADTITPEPTGKWEPKLIDGKCIITLFGKKYDMTAVYSEANQFDCGGDMTEIYRTKYGTDVSGLYYYQLDKPKIPTAAIIPTIPANYLQDSQRAAPTTGEIKYKEPTEKPEPTEYHPPEIEEEDD